MYFSHFWRLESSRSSYCHLVKASLLGSHSKATGQGRINSLHWCPSERVPDPIHKEEPSRPSHLPQTLPPSTVTLGVPEFGKGLGQINCRVLVVLLLVWVEGEPFRNSQGPGAHPQVPHIGTCACAPTQYKVHSGEGFLPSEGLATLHHADGQPREHEKPTGSALRLRHLHSCRILSGWIFSFMLNIVQFSPTHSKYQGSTSPFQVGHVLCCPCHTSFPFLFKSDFSVGVGSWVQGQKHLLLHGKYI